MISFEHDIDESIEKIDLDSASEEGNFNWSAAEPEQNYITGPGSVDDSGHEFADLYEKLFPYAFSLATKYVPVADAKDVLSEVFQNLWKHYKKIQEPQKIKSYLRNSVKNTCLNQIRSVKSRSRRENAWLRMVSTDDLNSDADLAGRIHAEKMMKIYAQIEKLPTHCRRVFKMAYLDNKKNKEIAAVLGIAEKTVKNHKTRGIQLIKIALLPGCAFLICCFNFF